MEGRGVAAGLLAAAVSVAVGASVPALGARGPAHHRRGHVHSHHRTTPRRKHPSKATLSAVIRRTAYGTPHIQSSSYAGAAYGFGYAFAQDNLCTMAEDYVTVDGQRSRYFGPSATYEQYGNSVTVNNLDSDLFFQQIIDSGTIERLAAQPPPNGPSQALRDGVSGYVAGYNRYLAGVGGARGVPDPTCRGKPWVHPITVADAYRRFYQLTELASGDVAMPGIAEAQPPTPSVTLPVTPPSLPRLPLPPGLPNPLAAAHRLAQRLNTDALGSNAVAVGTTGTRDHKHGLLLGNPHFPWQGTERFYQAQLTIPGKLNVEGATLFGVPLILIGHTQSLAWSHTVSTARRFTLYQLTLVPGSPTSYLYDGQPQKMTSRTVTVQALQPDGTLKPISRTLYSTRYGPMLNSLETVPLSWTPGTAFAMRDANAENFRVFNHFFETDRAQSVAAELAILKKYEGIPWVNTIAADRAGNTLYADIGAIPNVPNSEVQSCSTPLGQATFQAARLPVLDGSRSACNWQNDADASAPGLFGASHLPVLMRSDYVTNSNDSYWLSNPKAPLTGFAGIIGDAGTQRSLRTRIGLIMTQARVDGTDGLGPAGFTRQDMQNMVFSDRQYGGELVRDQLVGMCRGLGGQAPTSAGTPVAVGGACDILAAWDLHENLNSKGDVLFRLFWENALAVASSPYSHPFDANDPVHTPNGLDSNNPAVKKALGDAISEMGGAHIALDAAPGDVQFKASSGPGGRVALHGGPGDPDGDFNALYSDFVPGHGFNAPWLGSSYVQVVTWNNTSCPDAATILTYSESANPSSPHFSDQTQLYARKQWVPDRFCARTLRAHTLSTTRLGPNGPLTAVRRRASPHRRRTARHPRAHRRG